MTIHKDLELFADMVHPLGICKNHTFPDPGPQMAPHGPTLYSLLVRLRSVGPAYDESGRPERHKQFSFV